jgi:hypothetical protein
MRLLFASLSFVLSIAATPLFALESGRVTIDQRALPEPIEWGLTTPSGYLTGSERERTITGGKGKYTLSVREPSGRILRFSVYEDGTLQSSMPSTSATGLLTPGGELLFELKPVTSEGGVVHVQSTPRGMRGTLRGPLGVEHFRTPVRFRNLPQGKYTAYYEVPGCPPPRPLRRFLEEGGEITFTLEAPSCFVSVRMQEPEEEVALPPRPPTAPPFEEEAPSAVGSPVRVSLFATNEVTAGGTTRVTMSVHNVSSTPLRDLEIEYRYDGTKLTIEEGEGAEQLPNLLLYRIPLLATRNSWRQSVTLRIAPDLPGGTPLPSSMAVRGPALDGLPTTRRSASREMVVLGELPKTGWPLDLVLLLLSATMAAPLILWSAVKDTAQRGST